MEKKAFDQFSDDRLHQQVTSFYVTSNWSRVSVICKGCKQLSYMRKFVICKINEYHYYRIYHQQHKYQVNVFSGSQTHYFSLSCCFI